jgi:asparagine synthase (glutamine-hydrolysing)
MSGIVGILNLDGAPVDRDLLCQMTDFMSYRGPDAQEICINGNVGFGHTMLRTTFEAETEKQPLTLDGKVWLTADARIDGRAELISKLEAKLRRKLRIPMGSNGHNSDSRVPNDAELILYSYEAWGEDCVKHLIGDFAFAVWDGRERRLFCARDHFGVKPFYYAAVRNCLVFSNTLNALRLHPSVSDKLNEVAIGDFLLFGLNQDLSTTTFSDIGRLPAGSRLTACGTAVREECFWTPSASRQINYPHRDEYVAHFRELLVNAVDDRLRTNNVAVSMSGGLDSTSVAAVANDLLRKRSHSTELRAYAVVYDRLIPDEERHYSTLAASAIGIPITHMQADGYALYDERSGYDLDQPEPFLVYPTSAQFNDLQRLLASGRRVALTGWDGDAFMSEPPHSNFAALAKKLKFGQFVSDAAWFLSRRQLPPLGIRNLLKRMVSKDHHPKRVYPEWLDESFSKRLDLLERWNQFISEPKNVHLTRPYAFRVLSSTSWAPLFESHDSGISRLPLEVRHPLIDVRLVEYLLAIPPVPWCVKKEILKIAMADKLPERILSRPKTPLAGDPAVRLVEESSVEWLHRFRATPKLKDFVNVSACPTLAGEQKSDRLWTNLRPFGLNHWLVHSLQIKQKQEDTNGSQVRYYESAERRTKQKAISRAAGNYLR